MAGAHIQEMGFKTARIKIPEEVFAAKCSDSRLVGDRYNLRANLSVGARRPW